ncbi:CotH kinase family protein [Aquimarina sp. ERC-38]|uniref:CotH kinase family protein n=1 Tax=Aquimarina sp. ERC-38 TaxID=2949996 RepID=UPI002247961B|nr:CotH kinase family protein [Aquimarina sp. ERC-38]UZO81088.1 CotH kinase family protein [Aquimarina sp. ERC-38]
MFITKVTAQVLQISNEKMGIDKSVKLMVCQISTSQKTSSTDKIQLQLGNGENILIANDSISTQKSYQITYQQQPYILYFTTYPLVQINGKDSIIDEPKRLMEVSFASKDTVIRKKAGVELRGNISLKFPKKSYDLEFRNSNNTKVSEDVRFLKMRKDDDWVLDGIYNEVLRIRSHFGNQLWSKIYQLPYLDKEPKAKSGITSAYVEVFVNQQYKGIYSLTEQVDRKLLQLKDIENGTIQGELFKASSYEGAPTFTKAPEFKNIFPHWAGYTMEFPVVDYKSYWDNLYDVTKFVIDAPVETFNRKIAQKIDLSNAMDYFILVNVLRATDNLGKNFYLARYKKDTPYFIVPWDLDGVLGTIQDGKQIPTTDDILSNNLFDRLLKDNPDQYRTKIKARWDSLRTTQLKTTALLNTIDRTYQKFLKEKIYEREELIWNTEISHSEAYAYMKQWLKDRLTYLDTYFKEL